MTLFLAAVSLVLLGEKALGRETTFSIEPEPFNSFRYEEMRVEGPVELSIRTGRFVSVDPARRSANLAAPQTWNRYVYAFNNPLNYIDPDGEAAQSVLYIAVAEALITVYDAHDTSRTLSSPHASSRTKLLAGGLFLLGIAAPGGRYGNLSADAVRLAENVATGALGERLAKAAGILPSGPKTAIESFTGTAVRRVPDGLTATQLIEVKFGKRPLT